MSRTRTQILAVGVDKVNMEQALERCLAFLAQEGPHLVVTPNAEIAHRAAHDPALAALINQADLAIPDGAGIVLAARILGDPVPEKVAGADLATRLVERLSSQGRGRIFLLGAQPEVVAEAARRLAEQYPGVTIAGYRDGFFRPDEEADVVAEIQAARPDVLFAALGAPRQELWLQQHLAATGARLGMGVGGTIDIWAGAAQRAPQWMIRANLEWAFRIVKFGRYGRSLPPLIRFVLAVVGRRMRGR